MAELEIGEIQNRRVRKANDLIQKSHFNLTAQQQKMILYLIAQIKQTDKEFQEYTFSLSEFANVCGIAYEPNLSKLKDSIKKVADKSMFLKFGEEEKLIRWLDSVVINERKGELRIRFNEQLRPFLLELKKNYTEYTLLYPLYFKHKYTIRLYEWLKSIHYEKKEPYSYKCQLEDLYRIMGAEAYENRYSMFLERALKPACREINAVTDISIEIGEFRNYRGKPFAIEFIIRPKNRQELRESEQKLTDGLSICFGQYTYLDL